MVRSILVPVPPNGPLCQLTRAIWIAERGQAELTLLCVVSEDENAAIRSLEDARRKVMAANPQISIRTVLRFGLPAIEIVKLAQEIQSDLIILGISDKWFSDYGWSGEKAFYRFLPKSIAARVTQEAPCPIWLESPVAANDDWETMFCILDLNRSCDELVRYAENLATFLGMRPILFHGVMNTKIYGPVTSQKATEWQHSLIEKAKLEIAGIRLRCSTSATALIEIGDGIATLRRSAHENRSPLLVMDRQSAAWGDNGIIYAALRACGTSVLVRAEGRGVALPYIVYVLRSNPVLTMFILWLAMGIGGGLIYYAVYLAEHTDLCHLAQVRCDLPLDLLFYEPDTGPWQWGQ